MGICKHVLESLNMCIFVAKCSVFFQVQSSKTLSAVLVRSMGGYAEARYLIGHKIHKLGMCVCAHTCMRTCARTHTCPFVHCPTI